MSNQKNIDINFADRYPMDDVNPTEGFACSIIGSERLARKYQDDNICTHFLLQSVVYAAEPKALGLLVLSKNGLRYKLVAAAVHKMALREFKVLNIEEGGNPILEGKIEKLKWLKPRGTYKPPKSGFANSSYYRRQLQNNNLNLLAPGAKAAGMVYLSNMFRDLIGDPVLDTSHYILGTLHSVLQRQTFFNGNLLMRDVFGYNTYHEVTRLRGEVIGILVIAATLDLRKSGDENAELEFWQPPIRRMQEDHERVERVRQSRLTLLEKVKALISAGEKENEENKKEEEVNASAFEFDRFDEFNSFEELQKSCEKEFPDLFESEEESNGDVSEETEEELEG